MWPNLLKFNMAFFPFNISHKFISILQCPSCILEQITFELVKNNGKCEKSGVRTVERKGGREGKRQPGNGRKIAVYWKNVELAFGEVDLAQECGDK